MDHLLDLLQGYKQKEIFYHGKKKMHVVMALLQMQFSTSFFDSQEHLLIHLVQQVKLVGLVQA
jgi:hypothetical protein